MLSPDSRRVIFGSDRSGVENLYLRLADGTGAADVEGNAFYCPAADAIAWDRASLLPVLQDRFGEAAVVVVLSHELWRDRFGSDRSIVGRKILLNSIPHEVVGVLP